MPTDANGRGRRIWVLVVGGLVLLALAACAPPPEAPVNGDENGEDVEPVGYALEPVAGGFAMPVGVFAPADGTGRLFVVEQHSGLIRIIANGEVLAEPFLDLGGSITTGGEQGLLSMAFHPEFADNGRVYVSYTGTQGTSIVARYLVDDEDGNRLHPASAVTILRVEQPRGNHNGGLVAFGPDGYLYVGLGDGGGSGDQFNHGQNSASLLGAMLRIDVDAGEDLIVAGAVDGMTIAVGAGSTYGIPDDNPWADDDGFRDEFWAIGLRNPWRFSFDRATGDLWIADVGQNEWEEVNRQPASSPGGENYGWPIFEGHEPFRGDVTAATDELVAPVATYPIRQRAECAVTGGYVYRGEALPALQGTYLFGDWCSGQIWALTQDDEGGWLMDAFLATGHNISSFGEDADGHIYVVDHGNNASIYRLVAGDE